jgi:hypothetical protein
MHAKIFFNIDMADVYIPKFVRTAWIIISVLSNLKKFILVGVESHLIDINKIFYRKVRDRSPRQRKFSLDKMILLKHAN